jgi:hypothetical protein
MSVYFCEHYMNVLLIVLAVAMWIVGNSKSRCLSFLLGFLLMPSIAFAEGANAATQLLHHLNLTQHWVGFSALALFALAYLLAMTEEITDLRKSKPMVFAASLIWVLIAIIYATNNMSDQVAHAFRSALEGYVELFLFIMVSMTYLNTMEDRGVFESLRVWLLSRVVATE